MKKRTFIGVAVGCALLMLGCSNQKKDPIDDPDTPAVTDSTGITEGAEGIAGQSGSPEGQAAVAAGQSDSPDGQAAAAAGQSDSPDGQATAAAGQDDNSDKKETGGQTEEIGIEAAKKIALTKAGLNEQDGTWKEEKRDRDDGRVVYELEFVSGDMEYDFEIDAQNGKVLEYQQDPVND